MADNTLRLSDKDGAKPASTKYVILKPIYTAHGSYPKIVGAIYDCAEMSLHAITHLMGLGFLRVADSQTAENAKAINANIDRAPTQAMPASPEFTEIPVDPAKLPGT
jgi:hypothetical protein